MTGKGWQPLSSGSVLKSLAGRSKRRRHCQMAVWVDLVLDGRFSWVDSTENESTRTPDWKGDFGDTCALPRKWGLQPPDLGGCFYVDGLTAGVYIVGTMLREPTRPWIRPWKSEPLAGEVIAVSGDRYTCRTLEGMLFEVLRSKVTDEMKFNATTTEVREMFALERRVLNCRPVKESKWSSN